MTRIEIESGIDRGFVILKEESGLCGIFQAGRLFENL